MDFHYDQVKEIETRPVSAWLVEFEDGSKRIEVWTHEAKILDIVASVKRDNPDRKFEVGALMVGAAAVIELRGNDQLMQMDGRRVNQDLMVQI